MPLLNPLHLFELSSGRKFQSGVSLMPRHLTPWMVESAYRYLTAAKHLRRGHDMLDVAQINAAIGMEILLKSFVSKPDDKLGQVNETYKLDDDALKAAHEYLKTAERVPADRRYPNRHDLLTLFYAIPEPVRQRIRLDRREHLIEKYRDVFTKARYRYEKSAAKGSDDILIGILEELINDVVDWYHELGCKDMFIAYYGMPPLELLPDSDQEPETL